MAVNKMVVASRLPGQSSQAPSYHGSLTVAALQLFFLIMTAPGYFISRSVNDGGFYPTITIGVVLILIPVSAVVGGATLFRNRRQPWTRKKELILVWFLMNIVPFAFYIVSGAVFQLFFPGGGTSPDYIRSDEMGSITKSIEIFSNLYRST